MKSKKSNRLYNIHPSSGNQPDWIKEAKELKERIKKYGSIHQLNIR